MADDLSELERLARYVNWASNSRALKSGTRRERVEWGELSRVQRDRCRRIAEAAIRHALPGLAKEKDKEA